MKDQLVFPGSSIKALMEDHPSDMNILLGPGIRRESSLDIIAIKCGKLRRKVTSNGTIYWVDSQQKKYVAVKGERVIGVVVSKKGYTFDVDIGTSDYAKLQNKTAKLIIKVGDIIYAQISSANKDIPPEIVCTTPRGKKDGLGVLPSGGFMITTPLHIVRKLLSPECKLCDELGKKIKYEIAIGFNGRIYVKSSTVAGTLYVCSTIQSSYNELINGNKI